MSSQHTHRIYTEDGQLRVSVDAPGVAAVSAPIDPVELINEIAEAADLDVIIHSAGETDSEA
jgi:hypothetical protein